MTSVSFKIQQLEGSFWRVRRYRDFLLEDDYLVFDEIVLEVQLSIDERFGELKPSYVSRNLGVWIE